MKRRSVFSLIGGAIASLFVKPKPQEFTFILGEPAIGPVLRPTSFVFKGYLSAEQAEDLARQLKEAKERA